MVGAPGGVIESCEPLANFPDIVQVRVAGRGHTVVFSGSAPLTERGGPALATWLDGLGERRALLDMSTLIAVLRALEAFPPQFDATSAGFDMPNLGRSTFLRDPLTLTLVTGLPPEEHFLRATLTDNPWEWQVEARTPSTPWAPTLTLPLRH